MSWPRWLPGTGGYAAGACSARTPSVCRNRARNAVRDAGRADRKAQSLRPLLAGGSSGEGGFPVIADDRLRLIAMCCHPLLSANAQVALTLRMVAGLTTEEIARGFHAPIPTVAQRIAGAKRILAEHWVTFGSYHRQDP